jgi:hypothetical protein
MRDRDTVITHDPKRPHVTVAMQTEGATLTLYFDRKTAFRGDAPLREVRLTPSASGTFKPELLLEHMPRYLQYARASLAHDRGGAAAALEALRHVDKTRRGLSDRFLRNVAELYGSLVAEGEAYPVKALAASQHVDKSTASRWISAARRRGLLEPKEGEKK